MYKYTNNNILCKFCDMKNMNSKLIIERMLKNILIFPEISQNILALQLEPTYVQQVNCHVSFSIVYLLTPRVLLRDNRCLQRDNRRATRPCFLKLVSVNES